MSLGIGIFDNNRFQSLAYIPDYLSEFLAYSKTLGISFHFGMPASGGVKGSLEPHCPFLTQLIENVHSSPSSCRLESEPTAKQRFYCTTIPSWYLKFFHRIKALHSLSKTYYY